MPHLWGMKKFHWLLAMAGLWCGCGSPTPPDADPVFHVEYELYAPGLQEAPYLAGNAPSLGGWRPDGVEFSRFGEDVYRARFSSKAAAVECKLTLGTWDAEALDGEGFLRAKICKAAYKMRNIQLWDVPAKSPDLNPVEMFWGWLRRHLRSMDLADLKRGRKPLGRTAYTMRVKSLVRSQKAQAVAKKVAGRFQAACQQVVKRNGAAADN